MVRIIGRTEYPRINPRHFIFLEKLTYSFLDKCTGFSYIGPKLYNMIPKYIKEAKTTDDFKTKLKGWIWKNIH